MAATVTTPGRTSALWRRAWYRLTQFRRGLWAHLRPTVASAELEQARWQLPAPAFSLFVALPVDVQRHSLNVLYAIAASGEPGSDLAAAALLHDVGKLEAQRAGTPIRLWVRGPLVLAEALAPQRLARARSNNPDSGWRYALWVHFAHAEIGASWAAAAGCSPRTVWLIRRHADALALLESVDPLWRADLERLQQADNAN